MTDFERNIRTLIVCFVIAVMFLIPLVILESNRREESVAQVLGETDGQFEEMVENNSVKEVNDIVLPDSGLN